MFRSNAKLLISGEYLVMFGAHALALPLKYGQSLEIKADTGSDLLCWDTWYKEQKVFSAEFDPVSLGVISSNSDKKADYISGVLTNAVRLQSALTVLKSKRAISHLDFNIEWGLGSSSTLISNIAWWFDLDPFDLFFSFSEGSGYDIACARSDDPILYAVKDKSPVYEPVNFNPPFRDNLFFVYLGRKQDSADSVKLFRKAHKASPEITGEISEISHAMIKADSLEEFERLMVRHEMIISGIVDKKPVKTDRFSDYFGEIKSLGAWGGDFIMATSHRTKEQVAEYFRSKGLETIFSFSEIAK